ncbi:MAG: hypothetical protein HUU21_12700 [Polyangiaceae bacterium]|nr:hypothetical protein [Polyangiaceae bacterium]
MFALLGGAYAGCTKDFDQFEPTGASVSTGTGGEGGQGGQGGAGVGCVSDPDCNDSNACTEDVCAMGQCSHTPLADGPVPGAGADVPDDCVDRMCVAGVDQDVPDDTEVPNDSNACTQDACSGGSAVYMNEPADASCGGPLVCDGMGNCVGCTKASQCPPTGNDCKVRTCDNKVCGTMDVPEGMGCLGGVCNGMGACVECIDDGDCGGPGAPVCVAGMCSNQCEDGAMNGNETDVDCGGGDCPDCADGDTCGGNGDCVSDDCEGGICISCMDGQMNGSETDVDCGGDCAANCADGDTCGGNGDCASNDCEGGICISCMDGQMNGLETDVDCGGDCAANCAGGKMCNFNNDCQSNKCTNKICDP